MQISLQFHRRNPPLLLPFEHDLKGVGSGELMMEWVGGWVAVCMWEPSFFIELLAKEGFLIVATPYNVTFDHTVSAQVIQNRFNRCLDILSTSSGFLPAELSPDDVAALPIFSVGHR